MNRLFIFLFLFISLETYSYDKEIEQAKEAAPRSITKDASYMVWEKDHFVMKVSGTNEFVCLVLRDEKGRHEPSCLNRAAQKSVLPVYEYQTHQLEKGMPIKEIHEAIKKKAESKYFSEPDPGALVYMMSKKNKFYDHFSNKIMNIPPHVMLYFPKIKSSSLGFDGTNGLPILYDEYPHLSVVHIHTDK